MTFIEKEVIITGGGSGIGVASAMQYSKEGAEVAIVDKKIEKLEKVAEECATIGKKPLVIKADLSNQGETNTIVKRTIDAFGRFDILLNNAGMSKLGSLLKI